MSNSIAIDLIIIDRESRQRRELTDIDELAESMQRLGLIQPVVLDRSNNLIAGERRVTAAKQLGWTHIDVRYFDELDSLTAKAIELEENIKRKSLIWQDEARSVAEYHALRSAQEEKWSQADTGKALGLAQNTISKYLGVSEELRRGNQRVIEAPRLSTAIGIVEREHARRDADTLDELRKVAAPAGDQAKPQVAPDLILNEDFCKWAPIYTGPKFNFIHCDFPYGIDADKFNQGAAKTHGGYTDDEGTYWRLLSCLCDNLDRLATPSAHIMFWFSMHFYQDTLRFFADHSDFRIDPFPLIWTKTDNIGILPDPSRGPRRIYETCLFGSRGDRKVVQAVSNSFGHSSVRDQHMSIKPEAMLRHFFRMFVDAHTLMLDPTCGSGSSVRAAKGLAASHVVGLEINPEFAKMANIQVNKMEVSDDDIPF